DVLITIVGSIGRTAIVGDGIEVAFQRSVGILRPLNIVLSSYLFYALQTSSSQKKLAARTSKSAQGGVYLGELSKIEIPIPTLTEQQRIVDILDRFDTLVNDISQGLPAEIEARQNQYEYYRDRLLSFKRLTT
ncbi:MAG: restriction endonuclease subunit S, partial [Bacteroidales bacterium]|nr:restriction endonuclease subunit S [Bacteroidales bacterium]